MGHVSNITIKDEGVGAEYDWYRDLAFYYTTAGRLWRAVEDRWHENLQGEPVDYAKLSAKEFYYDDARARYLTRDVDPDTWATIGEWRWTDYAGMQPYGDFTTDANHAISEDKRYLSESGARVEQTVSTAATRYLHGDLLDSTMLATDAGGTAVSAVIYTAFGEPVGDASRLDTRYQYAGGWGYESDLLTLGGAPNTAPITLQHVGERWYQPNTGRFVQRDPIGLSGGLNLYAYCDGNAVSRIDPTGFYWDYDDIVDRNGFITRHYYDRGWTGWFRNEYKYSVKVPPGMLPPAPPRTFDVRCVAVAKSTILSADMGAIIGGIGGAGAGPEGIIVGAVAGGLIGGITGFISGVVVEVF